MSDKIQALIGLIIAAVMIVLGATLFSFSWGTIPAIILIILGVIIGFLASNTIL